MKVPFLLSGLLLATACQRSAEPLPPGAHRHADGSIHLPDPAAKPKADHDDHEHGDPHELGKLTLGNYTFVVTRFGDLVPGDESDFDLEFAEGTVRPPALRAWAGLESAIGSMKTRFENEGDRVMHGHVEVPKPLPDGARLWIAIEDSNGKYRGSLPLQ
jgi:hypothetical protein